jgi:two-component system chemotaxis response regulator CheY
MARKVLIVDDNATIRSLSRKVLEGIGFEVKEAEDGQAGVEAAQADAFQLVLADINMPRMNGIDMIAEIRKLDGYARVPILIISTENNAEIMKRGKAVGANGWLVKPFQREKLLGILQKLVKA